MKTLNDSEILEGNKLIAEFMGFEGQHEDWCGNNILEVDEVFGGEKLYPYSPDKEWNRLMPVVEKISTLKFRFGRFSTKIVTLSRAPYCRMESTTKCFRNSCYNKEPLIRAVYETVLDFLKWYNENQK